MRTVIPVTLTHASSVHRQLELLHASATSHLNRVETPQESVEDITNRAVDDLAKKAAALGATSVTNLTLSVITYPAPCGSPYSAITVMASGMACLHLGN